MAAWAQAAMRVPWAALAANLGPNSMAKNTEMGAEVRGRPANIPPIAWPHLREANEAANSSSGEIISLESNNDTASPASNDVRTAIVTSLRYLMPANGSKSLYSANLKPT